MPLDKEASDAAKRFIDSVPSYVDFENDSISIRWGKPGVGFGEFYIYKKDDKIRIENECMSKDFIKEILCHLVDEAELDD